MVVRIRLTAVYLFTAQYLAYNIHTAENPLEHVVPVSSHHHRVPHSRVFQTWWYLRQKPVGGGVRQVVSPTLPFPSPPPFPPLPFPFPLSFQTNQWVEGRSDPVRGKFPGFPPTNTTLVPECVHCVLQADSVPLLYMKAGCLCDVSHIASPSPHADGHVCNDQWRI